jgi:hypothetical protein
MWRKEAVHPSQTRLKPENTGGFVKQFKAILDSWESTTSTPDG